MGSLLTQCKMEVFTLNRVILALTNDILITIEIKMIINKNQIMTKAYKFLKNHLVLEQKRK